LLCDVEQVDAILHLRDRRLLYLRIKEKNVVVSPLAQNPTCSFSCRGKYVIE